MKNFELLQGDCLDLMEGIPDGSIDMVLTDPPYGMDYQSNRRVVAKKFSKIENDRDLSWTDDFIGHCHRVMGENTALYFFCSWHNVDFFKKAIERRFKVKNLIVWVKNNHGSGDLKAGYAPKHELVIYANKGRCINRGKRIPDVMEYDKIPSSRLVHPTEKNVEMLQVFINQSTDSGNVVLDPFMGSGTTGQAAARSGRRFVGMEINTAYFDLAAERVGSAYAST